MLILIWKPTIPMLFAKTALSCWMHPIAQTTLLPTPSHPWVPPEWPYCQQAQCEQCFTVKHSKAGLQNSSHSQNSASHLLGLQGPQQTPAYSQREGRPLKTISSSRTLCYILLLLCIYNCKCTSGRWQLIDRFFCTCFSFLSLCPHYDF